MLKWHVSSTAFKSCYTILGSGEMQDRDSPVTVIAPKAFKIAFVTSIFWGQKFYFIRKFK